MEHLCHQVLHLGGGHPGLPERTGNKVVRFCGPWTAVIVTLLCPTSVRQPWVTDTQTHVTVLPYLTQAGGC